MKTSENLKFTRVHILMLASLSLGFALSLSMGSVLGMTEVLRLLTGLFLGIGFASVLWAKNVRDLSLPTASGGLGRAEEKKLQKEARFARDSLRSVCQKLGLRSSGSVKEMRARINSKLEELFLELKAKPKPSVLRRRGVVDRVLTGALLAHTRELRRERREMRGKINSLTSEKLALAEEVSSSNEKRREFDREVRFLRISQEDQIREQQEKARGELEAQRQQLDSAFRAEMGRVSDEHQVALQEAKLALNLTHQELQRSRSELGSATRLAEDRSQRLQALEEQLATVRQQLNSVFEAQLSDVRAEHRRTYSRLNEMLIKAEEELRQAQLKLDAAERLAEDRRKHICSLEDQLVSNQLELADTQRESYLLKSSLDGTKPACSLAVGFFEELLQLSVEERRLKLEPIERNCLQVAFCKWLLDSVSKKELDSRLILSICESLLEHDTLVPEALCLIEGNQLADYPGVSLGSRLISALSASQEGLLKEEKVWRRSLLQRLALSAIEHQASFYEELSVDWKIDLLAELSREAVLSLVSPLFTDPGDHQDLLNDELLLHFAASHLPPESIACLTCLLRKKPELAAVVLLSHGSEASRTAYLWVPPSVLERIFKAAYYGKIDFTMVPLREATSEWDLSSVLLREEQPYRWSLGALANLARKGNGDSDAARYVQAAIKDVFSRHYAQLSSVDRTSERHGAIPQLMKRIGEFTRALRLND